MVEEGANPILEGGIVIASNLLDMLLQDHLLPGAPVRAGGPVHLLGGAATLLAVFPAVPSTWADAAFFHLRCLNGFVVSAVRRRGATAWVEVISEVRKTSSWPRSWANFSLFLLYSHWNAWANLHLLGQPNTFLARGRPRAAAARDRVRRRTRAARRRAAGGGRPLAL